MIHSCEVVSIPPISVEHFVRCVSLAVAVNAEFVPPFNTSAALYIRPLVLGSGPQINLALPEEYIFCVYVLPVTSLLGAKPIDALIMEDFDRTAPMGTGSAKVGGNYAPVLRWSAKARSKGYGITLHLDSKTRSEIDEFSAAGFIGIKVEVGGFKLVVPDSPSIIRSVTSDSCLQLAHTFGWTVETRPVRDLEFTLSVRMCEGVLIQLDQIRGIIRIFRGARRGHCGCARARQFDYPGISWRSVYLHAIGRRNLSMCNEVIQGNTRHTEGNAQRLFQLV
jgi:branched-chain amino acid aminotransferase